jgi:hypothetical protein
VKLADPVAPVESVAVTATRYTPIWLGPTMTVPVDGPISRPGGKPAAE